MRLQEVSDGLCKVEFVCDEPGEYTGHVRFDGIDIPGSPFTVNVDYAVNVDAVRGYGDGIEDITNCRAGIRRTFYIDASKSGHAPIRVELFVDGRALFALSSYIERFYTDDERIGSGEVTALGNGIYEVSYVVPLQYEGRMLAVHVLYDEKHIDNRRVAFLRSLTKATKPLCKGDALRVVLIRRVLCAVRLKIVSSTNGNSCKEAPQEAGLVDGQSVLSLRDRSHRIRVR